MLELLNIINIVAMIATIKLAQFARDAEYRRQVRNPKRMGLIFAAYYDAQLAILTAILSLSWLLAEVIGNLGAIAFGLLCLALLFAGPRMATTMVAAFSVPKIKKPRQGYRVYNHHPLGTYDPRAVRRVKA